MSILLPTNSCGERILGWENKTIGPNEDFELAFVVWVAWCPLKRYVTALTPSSLECDLIWR